MRPTYIDLNYSKYFQKLYSECFFFTLNKRFFTLNKSTLNTILSRVFFFTLNENTLNTIRFLTLNSPFRSSLVPCALEERVAQVENKRKEMVHHLLESAPK